MMLDMTDDTFDVLEFRVGEGDYITFEEFRGCMEYLQDRGVYRFHGMTKGILMEEVITLLEAVRG